MERYDRLLVEVGERITARRKACGMTERELAIAADMPQSQLSLYEQGHRSMGVHRLCDIAEALRAPLSCFQPESLDRYGSPAELRMVEELYSRLSAQAQVLVIQLMREMKRER